MKTFAKVGNFLALAILAAGLAFGGCQGQDESSSEGPAPAGTQNYALFPITITPGIEPGRAGLEIGEDGLGAVIIINGHSVEIVNGDTSIVGGEGRCADYGFGDVHCWIKLVNRDSNEWMTNAFIVGTNTQNYIDATLDNCDLADAVGGDTCKPIGGPDIPTPATGVGICYAEAGVFENRTEPYNEYGCPVQGTTTDAVKPFQMLHPECGAKSELWDFGVQVSQFTMFGSVIADYHPINPLGNPDFDFNNYATVYLMLVDLDDVNPGMGIWRIGDARRSTVLAGYGAADSGASIPRDDYFVVNFGVEFADRIETYHMADRTQVGGPSNLGYEYYYQYSVLMRYNPRAVGTVQSAHKTLQGKVWGPGLWEHCQIGLNCSLLEMEFNDHLFPLLPADSFEDTSEGWVGFYRRLASNFDRYFTTAVGVDYTTAGGGVIHWSYYMYIPQEMGHKGVAHINRAYVGKSISYHYWGGTTYSPDSKVIAQQGVDPDIDAWLGVWYFYTKPGASGLGSEFMVEVYSSYTQFNLAWTDVTLEPGGPHGGLSDDWIDYCWPMEAGPHGCDGAKTAADYIVHEGKETVNLNLPLGGTDAHGGPGGVQAWNVYVCVQ